MTYVLLPIPADTHQHIPRPPREYHPAGLRAIGNCLVQGHPVKECTIRGSNRCKDFRP